MKNFLFILSLLAISACEKELDYEFGEFQKSVVVNSILSTDSNFNVSLSYSKSIFSVGDFEMISNAEVKIKNTTNGQSIIMESLGDGTYTYANQPIEGHSYELEVTIDGQEKVIEANTYVPDSLDAVVDVAPIFIGEEFQEFSIDIVIEDNPDVENYYIYEVIRNNKYDCHEPKEDDPSDDPVPDPNGPDVPDQNSEPLNDDNADVISPVTGDFLTPDGYTNQNNINKKNDGSGFISDKEFSNNKFKTSFSITKEDIRDDNSEQIINRECLDENESPYSLKVMTVSADLFDYLKSVDFFNQSISNDTSIKQPVTIITNIENGVGIFGGVNVQIYPIK